MLDSEVQCAKRTEPGRNRLSSFLPFSITASGILMVFAALGAMAGLFFFFHGFSRLQEHRFSAVRVVAKTAVCVPPAPPKTADAPKCNTHEVIQLSPVEAQANGSESMTQQGKIAAALLRAGIPNPVTWADHHAENEVRIVDEPEGESTTATKDVDVSRVLQHKSNAAALQLPTREQIYSVDRKTSFMIWGGPALTLACIYILAAHFGWL
jgi:hypothetical protein